MSPTERLTGKSLLISHRFNLFISFQLSVPKSLISPHSHKGNEEYFHSYQFCKIPIKSRPEIVNLVA